MRAREDALFEFHNFHRAAIKIQSFWRMKAQVKAYKKKKIESDFDAKYNLKRALAEME